MSTFALGTFAAQMHGSDSLETREKALAKLISVRHCCFVRGVIGKGANRVGGDDDFRQAFRTVNRLYGEVQREIALQAKCDTQKPPATRRGRAA